MYLFIFLINVYLWRIYLLCVRFWVGWWKLYLVFGVVGEIIVLVNEVEGMDVLSRLGWFFGEKWSFSWDVMEKVELEKGKRKWYVDI